MTSIGLGSDELSPTSQLGPVTQILYIWHESGFVHRTKPIASHGDRDESEA